MIEPCPLCHSAESVRVLISGGKDFVTKKEKSKTFTINYCSACAVGYTLPFLSDEELGEYYPDTYQDHKEENPVFVFLQKFIYAQDIRLVRRVAHTSSPNLFELGSGRGAFLAYAKQKGMKVSGIEPSPTALKFARDRYGVVLQEGFASNLAFDIAYDVVIGRHVFEHINDPRACLKTIFEEGLKPEGTLILKIPKLDSWEPAVFGELWFDFELPRHRFHYTTGGIKKLLEEVGFSDVTIFQDVSPLGVSQTMQHLREFSTNKHARLFADVMMRLPFLVRLSISELIALALSHYRGGAGRMTIVAKKPVN